jgi:carbon monoxide dehydrogenase subunit G
MHLHLEGSSELKVDRETAYNRLTSLDVMTKSLPDAEDVKIIDAETAEATIKLRLALVSARLRMRVKILNKKPPSHAELSAEGSGTGSHVKINSTFDLAESGKTTGLIWSADADITGIMAGIGSTMLKGFAQKRVAEIFQTIQIAVEK